MVELFLKISFPQSLIPVFDQKKLDIEHRFSIKKFIAKFFCKHSVVNHCSKSEEKKKATATENVLPIKYIMDFWKLNLIRVGLFKKN
jgi:hypothetical protein